MAVMYKALIANGHLMAILWLLLGLSQTFDDCFSCNTPPIGYENLHGAPWVYTKQTLQFLM